MFKFVAYIQPASYYSLVAKMPQSILIYDSDIRERIGYQLEVSEKLDRAYCRLLSGSIPTSSNKRSEFQDIIVSNVLDNYIFLRRYFSTIQVLMVLVLRLLSLKNPFFELFCFFKSRKHNRVVLNRLDYYSFELFDSELVKNNPLVSIIIPTLNRYDYLKNVFKDLEKQSYSNFEVIVCDQSDPFDENFYKGWDLKIKVIRQEEKALWLARNTAIREAESEFIALSEDDVALPVDWLINHLKCLDFFKVDISAGVFYRNNGLVTVDSISNLQFKLSHQFPSGNSFLRKSVFVKIGLFDRQFEKQRMGDGEFGLRALLNGFLIVTNPKAFIIDIKAPYGGLRHLGSWDAVRPTKLFSSRPLPSVLYLIRKYFGNREARLYILKNIPQSFVPYRNKGDKKSLMLVYLILPFWLPLALLVVLKSWYYSSIKLKEGDRISYLPE